MHCRTLTECKSSQGCQLALANVPVLEGLWPPCTPNSLGCCFRMLSAIPSRASFPAFPVFCKQIQNCQVGPFLLNFIQIISSRRIFLSWNCVQRSDSKRVTTGPGTGLEGSNTTNGFAPPPSLEKCWESAGSEPCEHPWSSWAVVGPPLRGGDCRATKLGHPFLDQSLVLFLTLDRG